MSSKKSPLRLKTLSIGGATYDLFLKLPATALTSSKAHELRLRAGDKIRVSGITECCGGGASNTSVAFARLGCDARFCGVIGDDQWGQNMRQNLAKEGVNTASATIVERETSSFSMILSLPSGERTILYSPGTSDHLHDTTFDRDVLKHVDAVYINHLAEVASMIEDDLAEFAKAHPDTLIAWNPGGRHIKAGMKASTHKETLLKHTNLLLLNKEEALAFTRKKTIASALRALIDAGVRNICITDGKHGTYGAQINGAWHCPARTNIAIVDSTGAGDAFGSAASWALASGMGLQSAMVAGTLNAASVLQSMGAQPGLLTKTQILREMKRTSLSIEKFAW